MHFTLSKSFVPLQYLTSCLNLWDPFVHIIYTSCSCYRLDLWTIHFLTEFVFCCCRASFLLFHNVLTKLLPKLHIDEGPGTFVYCWNPENWRNSKMSKCNTDGKAAMLCETGNISLTSFISEQKRQNHSNRVRSTPITARQSCWVETYMCPIRIKGYFNN